MPEPPVRVGAGHRTLGERDAAAHLQDYRSIVRAYREEWPDVPLMAAVNAIVLKSQVHEDAKALLAEVDYLAFDPYTVFGSTFPSLYEEGLK